MESFEFLWRFYKYYQRETKWKQYEEEKSMGKFSTGLIAGAMIGVGAMLIDKKTMKKAKRMIHRMTTNRIWLWDRKRHPCGRLLKFKKFGHFLHPVDTGISGISFLVLPTVNPDNLHPGI